MIRYILCEFEYGYTGRFYQKVDDRGNLIEMLDEQGNKIDPIGSYGAFVVEEDPQMPFWS